MSVLARPRPGTRLAVVFAVLLVAPVTAELIQAYLDNTGDVAALAFFVLFLAPLYGGAALLIREVTVRSGGGWSARLLLAAGFGVLMTGVVDRSLFTPHVPEIAHYDEFVASASIGGVGLYALVAWACGHVTMSVGMPLALVETLVPRSRDRPWLGWVSGVVLLVSGVAVAVAINREPENPVEASWGHYAFIVVLGVGLVITAFSPVGRPVAVVAGRDAPPVWLVAVTAFLLFSCLDLLPGWPGLALQAAVLAFGATLVRRWSASPAWGWPHAGFLAWGALLSRTVLAFSHPTPEGVSASAQRGQGAAFLVATLLVGAALARVATRHVRTR